MLIEPRGIFEVYGSIASCDYLSTGDLEPLFGIRFGVVPLVNFRVLLLGESCL